MTKKLKTYLDPVDPAGDTTTKNPWLDEEVYKEVVEKTIITCSDAVITVAGVNNKIYLAKRISLPLRGLWFLGGRVQFNSIDMANAIADNVERETKYRLSPERFNFLVTNDYKFVQAAQGDFPARSFVALFHVEVSEEELVQLSSGLVASEYESSFGLQPFTREDLVRENVHPAILDAFDLVWF